MTHALDAIVIALLALAVALTIVCAYGVMVMRDPYQRLHFVAPPATLAAAFVVVAVALGGGGWQGGLKALVVAGLLTMQNAVVSHATARAAYLRARRAWPPPEDEIESVAAKGGP